MRPELITLFSLSQCHTENTQINKIRNKKSHQPHVPANTPGHEHTQNTEHTEIGNRKSRQPHIPANTPGHEQTQQIINTPEFNHHTHAQNNCL